MKISSIGVAVAIIIICLPGLLIAQRTDSLNMDFKTIASDDFNGAAYTIKIDDLKNIPVTDLSNLLTGLVPGFFSYQTSGGTVNEGASFWIRGQRTFSEGVLVLVDGQERDFGILSPYEVESITVLKDAASAVLYGTRAANGVILVTTKKGVRGKTKVEYTGQMINQTPLGLMEPVGALEYAKHYNAAIKNDGGNEANLYTEQYFDKYRNRNGVNEEIYPDVDWFNKYFKKSSWVQRHNLSIYGGNKNARFFINGGYLKQNGMFNIDEVNDLSKNNTTNRYNIRSNLDVVVTPSTKLNVELYGWMDQQYRPGGDSYALYQALVTTPANVFPEFYKDNASYLDVDGNRIKSIDGKLPAGDGIVSNPWAMLNRNGHDIANGTYGSFRTRLIQDLSFITPGLKASGTLSMDGYTTAVTNRTKGYSYYRLNDITDPTILRKTGNDPQMANLISSRNGYSRNGLNFQLSYDKVIGKHGIETLAFYDQFENNNQVSVPDRFQTIGTWLNYSYAKKYSIDLTGSYHGVYKFAPGKRFGFFPAVSAGWVVSRENFMRGAEDVLSYWKLRASYGLVGNQRGVTEFTYMGRMNAINNVYVFGNAYNAVHGFVEDIIANPFLTWEKSRQLNIGTDIRLFKNRLHYTVDYFQDHRTDIYMTDNTVSSVFGLQAPVEGNIGEMKTEGVDMAATWSDKIGQLGYRLGGTYSYSLNEVIKTGENVQPYPWMQAAGYSRGVPKGYVAMGLFQSYEEIAAAPRQTFSSVQPGDIRYKDINGDGIIDVNDRVPIGYGSVPNLFYAFHLGLNYKGVGFTVLFQGASEVSTNLSGRVAYPFVSNGNIYKHQLDYWTPENTEASLPRISRLSSNVNNSQTSSFWIQDASYLRLKTVDLYYEFPARLLNNSFIDNLRVFVSGYNLYVWTKQKGPLDPEDGGNSSSMPLTRNLSAGLSIRF